MIFNKETGMLKKKMFQLCVELTNGNMSSKALKKLTKSNLSRLMIQPFAKVYDINTEEILDEIDDFKNLNEFFIRKLRPDARPINQEEDSLVSPTDGVISEVGTISEDSTFIVKNQVYNVQTLVGDSELADKYKDGTYTGAVTRTNKGDFQVSVVVQGGKIANVNVLLQPNEEFSRSINKTALPKYVEEAIEAQSSDIALVSGASETFKGFKGSLQDALNKAK